MTDHVHECLFYIVWRSGGPEWTCDCERWLTLEETAAMLNEHAALKRALIPPKCPECGSGIDRPKCLFELPPDRCPRREVKREWLTERRKIVRSLLAGTQERLTNSE